MAKGDKLTPKQALFVVHYIKTKNATESARLSGYEGSDDVLAQMGAENLRKPQIAAKIQSSLEEQKKRVIVDADDILREFNRLGYSDVRGLFAEDGTVKPMKDWPDDLARAVASIEVEELFEYEGDRKIWAGYTKKIKLWNKNQALNDLGRHKKLFTDVVEINDNSFAEKLAKARKRKK